MITPIKGERLRNSEFIAFGKDVISIIEPTNPTTLGINLTYLPFKEAFEELSELFVQQRGSILTADIEDLDLRRDEAIVGIATVVNGHLHHFDESIRSAALRIEATIGKYGTPIQRLNLLAKTETIRNLVDDFEKELLVKNAITLLNLNAWVTELKDGNNAFNAKYLQRNEETSSKPEVSLFSKRKTALELYRKLVAYLKAKQTLEPTETLSTMFARISELSSKYNNLVDGRAGGSTPETDPATDPPLTDV